MEFVIEREDFWVHIGTVLFVVFPITVHVFVEHPEFIPYTVSFIVVLGLILGLALWGHSRSNPDVSGGDTT